MSTRQYTTSSVTVAGNQTMVRLWMDDNGKWFCEYDAQHFHSRDAADYLYVIGTGATQAEAKADYCREAKAKALAN